VAGSYPSPALDDAMASSWVRARKGPIRAGPYVFQFRTGSVVRFRCPISLGTADVGEFAVIQNAVVCIDTDGRRGGSLSYRVSVTICVLK
jgi:hypothetical protein